MTVGTMQTRVALLVDTDNIGAKYAEDLFKQASSFGDVIVRRGYGVMSPAYRWKKEAVLKYAIEPVARYTQTAGKNVTDIALVIEAMDLMQQKTVDAFCIASNDSDFSLLAMRLRQGGMKVYGFGNEHAHNAFVAACDKFSVLSSENEEQEELTNCNAPANPSDKKDIKKILAEAYDNYSGEDGWAALAPIGTYLIRINPAFSAKNYGGHKKLIDLVRSTEVFEIEHDSEKLSTRIKKKNAQK